MRSIQPYPNLNSRSGQAGESLSDGGIFGRSVVSVGTYKAGELYKIGSEIFGLYDQFRSHGSSRHSGDFEIDTLW